MPTAFVKQHIARARLVDHSLGVRDLPYHQSVLRLNQVGLSYELHACQCPLEKDWLEAVIVCLDRGPWPLQSAVGVYVEQVHAKDA